jgi:hypothetical protein
MWHSSLRTKTSKRKREITSTHDKRASTEDKSIEDNAFDESRDLSKPNQYRMPRITDPDLMRSTVWSAARERDWAIVAGSYAMHPRSSERLTVRDRPSDQCGAARRGAIKVLQNWASWHHCGAQVSPAGFTIKVGGRPRRAVFGFDSRVVLFDSV